MRMFKMRAESQDLEKTRKAIQDECKKVRWCPHCSDYNGPVKIIHGQCLKVVHDKYNVKNTPAEVLTDFMDQFNIEDIDEAAAGKQAYQKIANDHNQFIDKTTIELDAGTVYDLLDRIADEEIALFNMN